MDAYPSPTTIVFQSHKPGILRPVIDHVYQSSLSTPSFVGDWVVRGVVTRLGVAIAAKVVLFDKSIRGVLRETMSAGDGSYAFEGLEYRDTYFIVAVDPTASAVNAAISDQVTVEPMP